MVEGLSIPENKIPCYPNAKLWKFRAQGSSRIMAPTRQKCNQNWTTCKGGKCHSSQNQTSWQFKEGLRVVGCSGEFDCAQNVQIIQVWTYDWTLHDLWTPCFLFPDVLWQQPPLVYQSWKTIWWILKSRGVKGCSAMGGMKGGCRRRRDGWWRSDNHWEQLRTMKTQVHV